MALITRNKTTLTAAIVAKGEELRTREAAQSAAADAHIAAASVARSEAALASVHADAVDEALAILDAAGVSL